MIIFLYGADSFRSKRLLGEMKKKFVTDVDPESHSLSVLDGQSTNLKEISDKINTGSLFVKKRLIVIENIFKNKNSKLFSELSEYLKKFENSEEIVLIFWEENLGKADKSLKLDSKKLFALLEKQKFVQEFIPLTSNQLLSFIKKEAELYNKKIEISAGMELINLTNNDLWQISREIKKLSYYVGQEIITLGDVQKMVVGSYNEDIFALTDAISARNKSLTTKLLEEQYSAGLSDEYILTMLIRQFKILLQLREAINSGIAPTEMASKLKLHPYIVKKGLFQAKNFDSALLKNYINKLINLDFLNKNGLADIKTELSILIAEL